MKVSGIRSKSNSKTVQLTKGMLPTGNVSYTKTLSKTLKLLTRTKLRFSTRLKTPANFSNIILISDVSKKKKPIIEYPKIYFYPLFILKLV